MIVEFYPDRDSFGCNNLKSLITHLEYFQTTNEILYGNKFIEFKFTNNDSPNAIFVTDIFELKQSSNIKFSERNIIVVETLSQFNYLVSQKLLDLSKQYYIVSESYWDTNEYQFENVDYTLLYYSWELNDFQNRITNRDNVYHHLNYIEVPNQYKPVYDFLCLAGRGKEWRDRFIKKLLEKVDVSNALVSYFGENLGNKDLLKLDINYSREKSKFEQEFYSPIDDYRHSYILSYFTKPDLFSKTKFSIIVETEAENNEYHVTEKTLKCLLGGVAFIPCAQFETYKFLQDLGLEFNYDFDTSWDQDSGNITRFDSICQLIDDLAQYSPTTLLAKTQESTDFNRNFILDKKFYNNCERLNQQSLDQLFLLFT